MNLADLTPQQRAVFDLVVQGKSNKVIAKAIERSEGCVKTHMTSIFNHFGIDSRAELIARYYLEGHAALLAETPTPDVLQRTGS